MSELDGVCHEKHEPINIDSETRDRLRAFLFRPEAKGVGYSAFIDLAIREFEAQLDDCEETGDGECLTHGEPYETETTCEANEWTLSALRVAGKQPTPRA